MPDPEPTAALRAEYRDARQLDARIALHTQYSTHPRGFYLWVFDHVYESLGDVLEASILDIGCGSGRLWVDNQGRVPAGWRIVLADLSPGIVADAAGQLRTLSGQYNFAAADAEALVWSLNTFDAVIATHMLYHIADRGRAYREIRRVLKPGGRLYASANSRYTMRTYDELVDAARTIPARPRPTINDSGVGSGFNLENGMAELEAAFPNVVVHRYADSLHIPDAAPLVAYAAASGHLSGAELDRLQALVNARITADGPLSIAKKAGLFEARLGS